MAAADEHGGHNNGPLGIVMEEVTTLVTLNCCTQQALELTRLSSAKIKLWHELQALPSSQAGTGARMMAEHRHLEDLEREAQEKLAEKRGIRQEALKRLFTRAETEYSLAYHIDAVSHNVSHRFTEAARALGYVYQVKHEPKHRHESAHASLQEFVSHWAMAEPHKESLALAKRGRDAFLELEILAEEVQRESVESICGRNLDIFRDILCLPARSVDAEMIHYIEMLVLEMKFRVQREVGPDDSLGGHNFCPYLADMLLRGIVRSSEDHHRAAAAVIGKGKVSCKWMDHVRAVSMLGDLSFNGNRLALNFLGQLAADRSRAWDIREVALLQIQRTTTFDRFCLQHTNRKDLLTMAMVMMSPLREKFVNHNVLAATKKCITDTLASAPLGSDGDDFVSVLESAASSTALLPVTGWVPPEGDQGQSLWRECSKASFTREWEELVRGAEGLRTAFGIEESTGKSHQPPGAIHHHDAAARQRKASGFGHDD